MAILWWLIGIALVVSSALLWFAGIRGKEGIVRFGEQKEPEAGIEDEACRPEPAVPQEPAVSREPAVEARRVDATNVALGFLGMAAGIAALVLFAV